MNDNDTNIASQGKDRLPAFLKRGVFLLFGFMLIGIGISTTKSAEMGTSPISSIAYVMSLAVPALSMGTWLFLWFVILVIAQIAMQRKAFSPWQLLQLPLAFITSFFTDLGNAVWGHLLAIPIENVALLYAIKAAMILAGIVIIAIGISCTLAANLIMNPGDAFVRTLAAQIHKPFPTVKVGNDLACVLISATIGLIVFTSTRGIWGGITAGIGIATVITAALTGFAVKLTNPPIQALGNSWFGQSVDDK
ncbi:MAG: hypothetical protein A2Y16_05210 [Tenericutes bacterium GWF2_57_13]|nr:MAG: hypothetical protein A2Y16_05210 [Tenericutes bacterium GWF2_57_13]